MTRREPMGVEPHSSRARRDAPYRRTASHGVQTENNKRQQTIRIKDMRQGLHTLVQTQGLDGLQHLLNRLAPRGPCPAVLPIMCRGWVDNLGNHLAAARTCLP